MNFTPLQIYCLKEMQIPIWQYQCHHFFVYLEREEQSYNQAERALLSKILQALKWPKAFVEFKKIDFSHDLSVLRSETQPVLIFSDRLLNNEVPGKKNVIIPTLSSMLARPALKKQAWKKMQVFFS